MLRFACFFIGLLVAVLPAQRLYAQTTDELIGYYPFDTDCSWVDYSGSTSSNGAPCNTTNPACVCGVKGNAIKFDGLDDCAFLTGPINNSFDQTDFTLSFYMKPTASAGRQALFTKRAGCTENRAFYMTYSPGTNIITAELIENAGKKHVLSARLPEGTCWHLVTLVRAGSNAKLYINGTLQTQAQSTATARVNISNTEVLYVGRPCLGGSDRYFGGELDEIRVYDKALSPSELLSLALFPQQINTPDTIIYLGSSLLPRVQENCPITYAWSPTDGVADPTDPVSLITPTQAGNYVYNLAFKLGTCTAYDSMRVTVIDPSTLPCDKVYLPNAFTPNGDNVNDTYGISNPYAVQELISLEIFDRWGGRIFYTDNPLLTWDGSFNGQAINPGVLLYKVKFKCNGEERIDYGSLSLIR